jgi:hypothetical protein
MKMQMKMQNKMSSFMNPGGCPPIVSLCCQYPQEKSPARK